MANIIQLCGFESGQENEPRSSGGTRSIGTTNPFSGARSLKVNPTGTATGNCRFSAIRTDGRKDGEWYVDNLYTQFYFYVETAPSADDEEILLVLDNAGVQKLTIRLNSSRQLSIYDSSDASQGTTSTALDLSTWYRIALRSATGSGNTTCQLKINDSLVLNLSISQGTGQHGSIRLGKATDKNGESIVVYYDDLIISDNDWPPDCRVSIASPTANGSTAQWTAGTGASDYTQVDEVPPTNTDYLKSTGTAGDVHLVTIESCADAGIYGPILAIKVMANVREDTSTTSSTVVRLKSGSTTSDTDGYNTSTGTTPLMKLFNTDPATSAAWTVSGFDAIEVGVQEENAVVSRCEWIAVMVAWSPITGSISQIGGSKSQSASGEVSSASAVTGEIAQVGASKAQALTGALEFAGAINQTSNANTQSAAGALEFSGIIDQARSLCAQSLTGALAFTGSIDQTGASKAQALTGLETFTGAIEQTQSGQEQSASGSVSGAPVTGEIAQTGASIAQALTGALEFTGAIDQTGASKTQSATGALSFSGEIAQTSNVNTQNAAGALMFSGTISQEIDNRSQSASGTVAVTDIVGTIEQVGASTAQALTGALEFSGAIAQTSNANAQSAAGALTFTGAIEQTGGTKEQAGTGALSFSGTISQIVDSCEQALDATLTINIVGAEWQRISVDVGTSAFTTALTTKAISVDLDIPQNLFTSTEADRRSVPDPIMRTLPTPDSKIDAGDRRQISQTHRGP